MGFLSAEQLASLRAVNEANMPDSAQIQRPTDADDGQGGSTQTWSTIATVACRYRPTGGLPVERASHVGVDAAPWMTSPRLESVNDWLVSFPSGTDVRQRDRILIGGHTFEVTGVLGPRTFEVSRMVRCKELK